MTTAILELAELGIEHREHADIDCSKERRLLAKAARRSNRRYVRCVGCTANSGEIVHGLCGECRRCLETHYALTSNQAMPPRKPKQIHRVAEMKR